MRPGGPLIPTAKAKGKGVPLKELAEQSGDVRTDGLDVRHHRVSEPLRRVGRRGELELVKPDEPAIARG